MTERSKPELLAPAGDRECIRAAIENGADAVYFGLDCGFNARARAKNFPPEELPAIMAELHRRGLAGYVTLNTLVFPSELPEVERHIREVAAAGVDAVLVQDLGLVRLIREICPDLLIHASTQMTMTSSQCIAAALELGVERVVLARECSVEEIRRIGRETTMPLEVFVHGALCVAYSGQCLTSESLGGRSANRGQCAQACRLPYDLVCDGRDVDLGEQKYLLSPQDLAAYDLIPQLIDAGVCSFKIEGRLKTPEYVANIVRHYRQAIDAALAGRPVQFTPRDVEEMELSFSRGFSHGWLDGCDHKTLVPGLSSSKRGVLVGHVEGVRKGRVIVRLGKDECGPAVPAGQASMQRFPAHDPQKNGTPVQPHVRPGRSDHIASLKPGDGVVFDCGRPVDDEQGGRVYEVVHSSQSVVEIAFAHGAIDFAQIGPGQRVWKTDDPELTRRLRKTYTNTDPQRRTPVDLTVHAAVGEALQLQATTDSGLQCELSASQPCEEARKHPLTEDTLREQFSRLGGTPFELRNLTVQISGRPMLPLSILGQMRHELVARMTELAQSPPPLRIAAEAVLPRLRHRSRHAPREEFVSRSETPTMLHVLVRSLSQLREVLAADVKSVYADFQDIREYRPAVGLAREHAAEIFLATPRIQKPDELGIFHALSKHGADGILVRNLAGLRFYRERGVRTIADFSLNCANDLTARYLMEQGSERITASYDLNREQLLDLVSAVPPEWLEVVIHQHMPMFHMEHCVFCSVLSPGTNKTNCGRPCDTHEVKLRDRLGVEHPLTADVGCRNTLFNAVPQSGAEVVPQLLAAGVRQFRIECGPLAPRAESVSRSETTTLINLYRRLLIGDVTGKEVWSQLKASNRVGVTRGTLEERRNPLAIL